MKKNGQQGPAEKAMKVMKKIWETPQKAMKMKKICESPESMIPTKAMKMKKRAMQCDECGEQALLPLAGQSRKDTHWLLRCEACGTSGEMLRLRP